MKKHLSSSLVAALCLPLRAFVITSLVICLIHGSVLPAPAQTKLMGLATEGGAFGGGTVFQLNLDGSGLTALYDFQSSTGNFPIGSLIEGDDGLLYGVTKYGGASGFGTIFRINPDGTNHTVLFHFTDLTGHPAGPMLMTRGKAFFGITMHSVGGYGTVYKISPDGIGYKELYRFSVANLDLDPGFLMQAANGSIYGTTYSGGGYGYGHVFRMDADGSNPTILVHFSWEDGEHLHGGLMQANDGALYGTTAYDGMVYGEGVVYRLAQDAAVVNVIHHFNSSEGNHPGGTLVQAPDNELYGMTLEGGVYNNGALYKISADSADITILENFDGDNGKGSATDLVYYSNHLYGFTTTGGLSEGGVIFSYNLINDTYSTLAALNEASGTHPMLGGLLLLDGVPADRPTMAASNIRFSNVKSHSMTLTFDPGNGINRLVVMKPGSAPTFQPEDDSLYIGDVNQGAMALYNGPGNTLEVTGLPPDTTHYFAVFEYNTNYAGNIRYLNSSFAVADQSTSSYQKNTAKFIGVTRFGGKSDAGTMFSMDANSSEFTVLYNFDGLTGSHQVGNFLDIDDGYLYGVSRSGGAYASGTLYKIRPDGTEHTVIHNFTRDEGYPTSPPVRIENGTFIGISLHDEANYGTVYKMNPDGTAYTAIYQFGAPLGFRQPGYIMQASSGYLFVTTYAGGDNGAGMVLRLDPDGTNPLLVHSFSGDDGIFPYSVLTESTDSTLYGVAHLAGPNNAGVVYRIGTDGSDFDVIHAFNGGDGAFPSGAVTQGEDGTLYGMTIVGGMDDGGVLYKINPNGSGFHVLQYFSPETGKGPGWDLLLHDNKLYGLTSNGGLTQISGKAWPGGTAFSYDLETNTFQKLLNLTPRTGIYPYMGGLIKNGPDEIVPGVQDFSLVDTRTGETILTFEETVTVDVGNPDFRHWTIRANTYPDEVGSVVFKIDVQKKNVENKAPYLLASRHLRALSPIPHILEAEAYSERLGRGSRLQSRAALIRFINNTEVTGFEVLDTNGDKFRELHDGDVLNVQNPLLRTFNIRALLNRSADRGSVEFHISGEPYWTENQAPYIMVSGNRQWWSEPGLYTVTAIPHSGKNRKGMPGTPATVSFYISDAASAANQLASRTDSLSEGDGNQQARVSIYPVPAKNHLTIRSSDLEAQERAHVMIWDMSGLTRYNETIQLTAQRYTMDLAQLRLQKGTYFIRVKSQSGTDVFRFLKE